MKSLSTLLTIVLLAFGGWKQLSQFLNNYKREGIKLNHQAYPIFLTESKVKFAPEKSRAIAIFWATWCAPCKIEMSRLKNSIDKGKIPKGPIFAINPFEANETIEKYLSQNKYPFTFIDAGEIAHKLGIASTPTTLFIENQTIASMTTGLSLIGIWRAEFFL